MRNRDSLVLPVGLKARIRALMARERISFSAAMRITISIGLQVLEQQLEQERAASAPAAQPNGPAPTRRVFSKGVG